MSIPDGFRLSVEEAPSRADRVFIDQALDDFNAERWPGHPIRHIAVILRDAAGRIAAGLDGVAYGGWLFVHNLWVSDPLRRRGVGRALMARLARIAVERQWGRIDFHVLDWNPARAFYHRLGMAHVPEWLRYGADEAALRRLAAEDRRESD